MKNLLCSFLLALPLGVVLAQGIEGKPSMPGAKVYFVNLADGDTVTSPFKVIFGLSGMGIAPAGIDKEGTGHHHLLVDRPPVGEGEMGDGELNQPILADENNRHFGAGQTETVLGLPSGTHTLQLVLGDYIHVPHTPPVMSEVITITVE
ncbi:MAG: DUF4399 domain-containing protein [Gammaproteobacteria bacterium]|nr:DUF4399 domain-containing protein [Gammaproteobacteria bacterium]